MEAVYCSTVLHREHGGLQAIYLFREPLRQRLAGADIVNLHAPGLRHLLAFSASGIIPPSPSPPLRLLSLPSHPPSHYLPGKFILSWINLVSNPPSGPRPRTLTCMGAISSPVFQHAGSPHNHHPPSAWVSREMSGGDPIFLQPTEEIRRGVSPSVGASGPDWPWDFLGWGAPSGFIWVSSFVFVCWWWWGVGGMANKHANLPADESFQVCPACGQTGDGMEGERQTCTTTTQTHLP